MRAWRWAAVGAAVCWASAAHAEPETWSLAEALDVVENRCMTESELAANVRLWLGRPSVDRRIQIVVDQLDEDSLRFVLSRDGKPSAERRFHTSDVSCVDLRAAVALAIALAIDATVMQAILEPVPEAPAPPAPKPSPAPARPPAKSRPALPPAPPEERVMLEVDAQVLALVGVLPEPVLGASIGAAAPLGDSWHLRVSGWGTAARSVSVGAGSSETAMVAGQASLCLDDSSLRACAGGAAGRWSAEGRGFARDRTTNLPWAALVADLGVSLPLAELVAAAARIHGYFPVVRPALEERAPRGQVLSTREPPPAGLGVSAGLAVGFR